MKRVYKEGNEEGPVFDIPLENELLILKLKAEFGAECSTGDGDIPPIIINEFLRSVYEFEHRFREPRPTIRLFEKLGQPYFRKAEELKDAMLSRELKRLLQLLQQHQLELDVMGEYPDRTIYKFITEEFLFIEIEDMDLPGYIHHYSYEDFHPNHELDIRQRSVDFLSQWFSKQLNDYSWELADTFIHPDTREFNKQHVLKKVNQLFDAYECFMNCEYLINRLEYEWHEKLGSGRAIVEGQVRYDARTECGELVHREGPFEFYLSNTQGWWSIFYFVFPGFNWND